MSVGGKSSSTSKRSHSGERRPKASTYDMFLGQQTRLKATEANRKRLLASGVPVTPPVLKE
jgi:hypothetical protein